MATVDSFQPAHFGIKKEAIHAFIKLSEAQEEVMVWPCKSNPYFYMDYDGYGFEDEDGNGDYKALTIEECESLCHGCPLLKLCYDFAVKNQESTGIWGGVNFSEVENEDKLF